MNATCYNLIGIRRSGQHGIAHWLTGQTHAHTLLWRNKLVESDKSQKWKGQEGNSIVTMLNYEEVWEHGGVSSALPTVLVMRSIKNLVASRIKVGKDVGPGFYDLYKAQAEAALGRHDYYPNVLFIYYDRWFTDPGYRERVTEEFSARITPATFTDDRFSLMTKQTGSSWSGCEFNGKTHEMPVLERYKLVDMPDIPVEILALSAEVEERANGWGENK